MTIQQAAEQLVSVAKASNGAAEEVGPAVKQFFEFPKPSIEDAAAALAVLAAGVQSADGGALRLLAMAGGALVERGLRPGPLVPALLHHVRCSVPMAVRLVEAVLARLPPETPDETVDREVRFEAVRAKLSPEMPDGSAAWQRLTDLYPPTIAVCSASPDARASGRDPSVLGGLDRIAEFHAAAGWIAAIVRVLHDEPFVALEPATGRGIEGRMSGISENFQLHVLLMDVFPKGLLERRRVSAKVAAVARGDGPQQTGEAVTGAWNLYAWTALRPDASLPDPKDLATSGDWIWNEGTPLDIPLFEGQRVILLGPPAYPRSWNSARTFSALRADLNVDRILDKAEVRDRLARIAAALRPANPE